jgi:hypothetical protein
MNAAHNEWRKKIRIETLAHYSNGSLGCACCNEPRIEFLAIDHINGGGSRHRKQIKACNIYVHLRSRGFPAGYRVLCHNCNQSLGLYGYCPHSKESTVG